MNRYNLKEYLVEKFQYLDIHIKQQSLQIEEIYQWREPSCHNMNELNKNIRAQTEKEIYNMVQLNYTNFFQAIVDIIQTNRHILENKQYCNLMFEHIASVLTKPDQSQIAYQIMYEFCKHCYHIAINYLQFIIKFTINHMRMRNQDSARALFLWETISTEYLEIVQDAQERVNENHGQQVPNLIKLTQNQISPEILRLMIIKTPEDLDFVELRQGATATLTGIVKCCDQDVVDKVADSVSVTSQSTNPSERQAAVILFSTLRAYPDRHEIVLRIRKKEMSRITNSRQVKNMIDHLSGIADLHQEQTQNEMRVVNA